MKRITRTLIVIVCAAAFHAEAQTNLDELKRQLSEAELALGKSRLMLPDCSAGPAAELATYAEGEAKKLGLKTIAIQPVEGTEKVALDNGHQSPVRLSRIDITGRGSFEDVDHLLRRIAMQRLVRLLDFETLSISAAAGATVTLNARVSVACWSEPPPPPPLEERESDLLTPLYRQRLDIVRSALDAVRRVDARSQPNAPLDALAALDKDWKNRAAALTEFHWNHGVATLRGVVIGAQARAQLDASLKNAGFDAGHAALSAAGDCHAFTVTAPVIPDDSRPHDLAFDLFDERAAALCDSQSTQPPVAVSGKGNGKLTLHLRDADVADLFYVLNAISPQDAFVVEPGVKGRVNIDLENVTAAEALAAIAKSGAAFVGPGPLHRVCRIACTAPTATSKKYSGELITLTVRDADILDILRVLEEISGLKVSVSRTLDGHIGVFAQDMQWDRVFDGIVSAFHLTYTIEGNHFILGHGTPISLANAAKAHSVSYRRPWTSLRDFEKVGTDDIHLAALVSNGDTWSAYAYVPGSARTFRPIDVGGKLFDASVTAIGPAGVTFKTGDGREIVLPLP